MQAIMQRILAFFMTILMTLFPSMFGKTDVGEVGCVAQGSELVVTLASNPTTGSTWVFSMDVPDRIMLVSETYVEDDEGLGVEQIAGRGGHEIFEFKSLSAGEVTITFNYGQQWLGGTLFESYIVKCEIADNGDITVVSAENIKDFH